MGAKSIVVAGDIAIDWLEYRVPAVDEAGTVNWRGYAGSRSVALPGGAFLLARMVDGALEKVLEPATRPTVLKQSLGESIEKVPPREIIHSVAKIAAFPLSADDRRSQSSHYRVDYLAGFSGPDTGELKCRPVDGDSADASIVVLGDAGNGFRDAREVWPVALTNTKSKPWVVYKVNHPLVHGDLWDLIWRNHRDRAILVVDADDLRLRGAQISTRLSWERMATDCLWQLAYNPKLAAFQQWPHIVIRFDLDGAIYVTRNGAEMKSILFYDPHGIETGFRDRCDGNMVGIGCAFTSALTARLAEKGIDGIHTGIGDGIASARRLLRLGFGVAAKGNVRPAIDYPIPQIFDPKEDAGARLSEIAIPAVSASQSADPNSWCILHNLNAAKGIHLERMAHDIVINGFPSLRDVPVARFGGLRTVDRLEIESFRAIENLIDNFQNNSQAERPLSIAVFGPPGSGKSFGVKAVAKYVAGDIIKVIEFNVSQFTEVPDLIKAFHRVRDEVLRGFVPLVFFDEFDSKFQGEALGWLKYFLAPMQDGKFKDGETEHPLGKVIFVFAGGTSKTFAEFCCVTPKEIADAADGEVAKKKDNQHSHCDPDAFRNAKGPDFVSRLRGYVNVLGPNKLKDREPEDVFYPLRRAVLLRGMIERGASHLLDSHKVAQLDPSVLAALIGVSEFKHGARSMEAILDMSSLVGKKQFDQSALPPIEQLNLHVDAAEFTRLVLQDVLFGSARDMLAKQFHDRFRQGMKGQRPDEHPSMLSWEDLDDGFKDSNRKAADHIPVKLKSVGYGFKPALPASLAPITFPPDVEEQLAKLEHDRYCAERAEAGWKVGPYNKKAKTNPTLVPWDKLDASEKQKDHELVRAIPEFMAKVRFQVFRLSASGKTPADEVQVPKAVKSIRRSQLKNLKIRKR